MYSLFVSKKKKEKKSSSKSRDVEMPGYYRGVARDDG